MVQRSLKGPARLGALSVVVGIAPASSCEEMAKISTERTFEIPHCQQIWASALKSDVISASHIPAPITRRIKAKVEHLVLPCPRRAISLKTMSVINDAESRNRSGRVSDSARLSIGRRREWRKRQCKKIAKKSYLRASLSMLGRLERSDLLHTHHCWPYFGMQVS